MNSELFETKRQTKMNSSTGLLQELTDFAFSKPGHEVCKQCVAASRYPTSSRVIEIHSPLTTKVSQVDMQSAIFKFHFQSNALVEAKKDTSWSFSALRFWPVS